VLTCPIRYRFSYRRVAQFVSLCLHVTILLDELDQGGGSFKFFQAKVNCTNTGVPSVAVVHSSQVGWSP
jgi:hypothetical protein